MHHVIIGAGPAGVNAAEHIRKYDPNSVVTLLAAEQDPPYSRICAKTICITKTKESLSITRVPVALIPVLNKYTC